MNFIFSPKTDETQNRNWFCVSLILLILLLHECYFDLFLLLELTHIQVVIETLFRQQLIMLAALNDLTRFQDQDHIRITNGGKAMSDNERRATLEQFIESFLDETLGSRVHAGGCFVQN